MAIVLDACSASALLCHPSATCTTDGPGEFTCVCSTDLSDGESCYIRDNTPGNLCSLLILLFYLLNLTLMFSFALPRYNAWHCGDKNRASVRDANLTPCCTREPCLYVCHGVNITPLSTCRLLWKRERQRETERERDGGGGGGGERDTETLY